MRFILPFTLLCLTFTPIYGQLFTKTKAVRITEKNLGEVGFHLTNIQPDGRFKFISDAENKAGIFIGEIAENEILTHHYRKFTQFDNDLKDLRLEDTDRDGYRELYALYESLGLLRLDTATLAPLDTFTDFPVSPLFRKIILADIDHDLVNEWLLLDGIDGLICLELTTFSPIWEEPALKGLDMDLGNMDGDLAIELVLHLSDGLHILNIETLDEEYFLAGNQITGIELVDLNLDGADELIITEGTVLKIYDHSSTSIVDAYNTGAIHFDDRIYYNLDADPDLEIILYQPDFKSFRELNTFPLTLMNSFSLPEDAQLGWHIGFIPGAPEKLVFLPDQGISVLDYPGRSLETTKITGAINGMLSARFDHLPNAVFISRGGESFYNYITFRDLNTYKCIHKIAQDEVFQGSIAAFAATTDIIKFQGLKPKHLLLNNREAFSIYNVETEAHQEYFDLQGNNQQLSDLDHDGTDELLNMFNNSIHVYTQPEFGKFSFLYSTPAREFSVPFRTGQLDQSPEKEIISYNYQKIIIYSGKDGTLLREITAIPSAVIQDIVTFTDTSGNFFMGVMHSGMFHVYNYTQNILVKSFPFSGSTNGATQILQSFDNNELKTYILLHSDRFQVYTPSGMLVYSEDLGNRSGMTTGKILITDIDRNNTPEILLSSGSTLTTYNFNGAGPASSEFYLTHASPGDSVKLNKQATFTLQFSEPVLPASLPGSIQIKSAKQGPLQFAIEWISDMMVNITHDPLQHDLDTLSLTIYGNLQSESLSFFDSNLDGISLQGDEEVITFVYLYDISSLPGKPTISLLSPVPSHFYTNTARHLEFSASTSTTTSMPISSMHYGIISAIGQTRDSIMPVDKTFDESLETFSIPVKTYGLADGSYIFYVVARDNQGFRSDTFFLPISVTHESGYYDKHEGSGPTRTQYLANAQITSSFNHLHTEFHTSGERLSHIVGGDGFAFYLLYTISTRTLTLRKVSLPDCTTIWEHSQPSYAFRSSIHLSEGLVHFFSQTLQGSEFRVFAFDAISGFPIWNQQIYPQANTYASPVSDAEHLLVTGGEYGGTYCFDRWTGEQKWYSVRENIHPEQGIPSLYKDAAYLVEHNILKSVKLSTGELNWEIEVNEEEPYLLYRNALVDTIHQQFLWPGKNNLYAFDLETGAQKWRKPGSNSIKNPVQFENLIFLFKSNAVQTLNATTGNVIRTKTLSANIEAQPVGANGKIFLPLTDSLLVLDMYSLATLWSVPVKAKEISIIDQYLLLTDNMQDIHVYESIPSCCTPAIEWTETQFSGHFGEAWTRRFTYDSVPVIQNGNLYHEILASDLEHGGNWEKTNILIRESEDKLYMWLGSNEEVLVDYTLELNESFTLFTGVELTVVAIDTILLETGESRRRLQMQCDNWPPIYWIEGIGTTSGLTLSYETCFADVGGALLCLFLNGQLLYDHPEYNTCWLQIVSTEDIASQYISYFPNPANDHLTIRDPEHRLSSVSIYSLGGQLLGSHTDLELDISKLEPGVYQLCFTLNSGERRYDRLIKL